MVIALIGIIVFIEAEVLREMNGMKMKIEYGTLVVFLIAFCSMTGAYGSLGGNSDAVSPLFNVRMDQAIQDMGAGIPGLDPNNKWSYGSINEGGLATSNKLTQSEEVTFGKPPATTQRTCFVTCKKTCSYTCGKTCAETCQASCGAVTCGQTCSGQTCSYPCTSTITCGQT